MATGGLAGSGDRLFPAELQQRVARERLGIELDVIPGGHLVALAKLERLGVEAINDGLTGPASHCRP